MKKIFFIVSFIIIAAITIFAIKETERKNNDYVLLIDGSAVTRKEYLFLLYEEKIRFEKEGSDIIWEVRFDGIPASEIAKQNALDTARLVKLSSFEAKKNQLNITFDDEEDFNNFRDNLFKDLPAEIYEKIGLTEEEKNIIARDNFLYFKIFNKITESRTFEQSELNDYVAEYIDENKELFQDVYASYIIFENPTESNDTEKHEKELSAVAEEAKNNVPFDDLIKKYSYTYEEGSNQNGISAFQKVHLDRFPSEVILACAKLEKNEVSDLIKTDKGYYILKIDEILERDLNYSEIEQIENQYIINERKNFFNKQFETWKERAETTVNYELLETISIDYFD